MSTLFYARQGSSNGRLIYDALLRLIGAERILACADHRQLNEGLLARDLLVDSVVLISADVLSLDGFRRMRSLLDGLPIFLFLHSSDNAVIAKGHSLRPRFVSTAKEGLPEFVGVLENFFQKRGQDEDGGSDRMKASLIAIFNLLIRCPFRLAAKDCPALGLRQSLNTEQKFSYAQGLSEKEAQAILQFHDQCFANRLRQGGENE